MSYFDTDIPVPVAEPVKTRKRIRTHERVNQPHVKDAFFEHMTPGDSYFFDGIDHQHPNARRARSLSKRTDMKFTAKREGNGLRIWRIK